MSGLTLTQAQENLDAANAAYTRALNVKSYSVEGSRAKVNHDIDKLLDQVKYWQKEVDRLSSGRGGIRIRGATPT